MQPSCLPTDVWHLFSPLCVVVKSLLGWCQTCERLLEHQLATKQDNQQQMVLELRWLDQALQRVAAGKESGVKSMWGVQGASLDQQGMGQRAQVQLQHNWGRAGHQGLSSHTAPAQGVQGPVGASQGNYSNTLKSRWDESALLMFIMKITCIWACYPHFLFSSWKKTGSCIIYSEYLLSKGRNYSLKTPKSFLWPQKECQLDGFAVKWVRSTLLDVPLRSRMSTDMSAYVIRYEIKCTWM